MAVLVSVVVQEANSARTVDMASLLPSKILYQCSREYSEMAVSPIIQELWVGWMGNIFYLLCKQNFLLFNRFKKSYFPDARPASRTGACARSCARRTKRIGERIMIYG